MLLTENGGGNQHRNLLAVEGGAKGRPDRDFRLAVADVATDEPVHRLRTLHVSQSLFDRAELIRCFLEGESGFEFFEEGVARRERMPFRELASGVHGEQLGGHVAQ